MSLETITKLKIAQHGEKLVLNKPDGVRDFDGMLFDTVISKPSYDLIFAFIFTIGEFTALLRDAVEKNLLRPNGYLYVAYPKKGNKQYKQFIGRDDFFGPARMDEEGYVMGSRIKFNKMVAYDEVFTCIGLKHITGEKKKAAQPSQCVGDYLEQVPVLQKHFARENPAVLALYNQLAPGYQRDWARYIYSTKSEETVRKRLAETAQILLQGYKSKDHFRQGKKS